MVTGGSVTSDSISFSSATKPPEPWSGSRVWSGGGPRPRIPSWSLTTLKLRFCGSKLGAQNWIAACKLKWLQGQTGQVSGTSGAGGSRGLGCLWQIGAPSPEKAQLLLAPSDCGMGKGLSEREQMLPFLKNRSTSGFQFWSGSWKSRSPVPVHHEAEEGRHTDQLSAAFFWPS